jgi:predicted dehydrogenase
VTRRRLRFGLIGAGAIATAYASAMERASDGEFVGVADVCATNAQAFAHACGGIRAFTDWRDMLTSVALDAVIVCTPPDTHPEIAIGAARAGVHVLCEKPLAIDLGPARAMLAVAAESSVILTMATKFRYVDDIVKARNALRLGMIGDVVLIANEFKSIVDMSERWNSDPARSGGGVLIDNGTHSVDILRFLLGPLEGVSATEGPRRSGLRVEETVRLYARSERAYGIVDLSWSEKSESPYYVRVVGTRGRISLGWKESLVQRPDEGWQPFGTGYDKVKAFCGQLTNFIAAIRGEATVEVGPDDALASVAAIDAAYASLSTDAWTRIDDSQSQRLYAPGSYVAIA